MKRFLFIKRGCPYCHKYMGVIQNINSKLKIGKRIRVIDITLEDFDINLNQVVNLVRFEGTPFLYLDGFCVQGMTTREYAYNYITSYLKMVGDL